MSKKELMDELSHIEVNCEFSKGCLSELKEEMLMRGYVDYYDNILQLTPVGEEALGLNFYDKDEDSTPTDEDITNYAEVVDYDGDEFEMDDIYSLFQRKYYE